MMNEVLVERFRAGYRNSHVGGQEVLFSALPQQLNLRIREYFMDAAKTKSDSAWTTRPEIPTSAEVLDEESGNSPSNSDIIEIVPNKCHGAWESKEAYLSAHYELLREDAVKPLRDAVGVVRGMPLADENALPGAIGIYEKVHVCAFTASSRGLAIRITFSLKRTGKKILWEQSKRLISGSLVVLTPAQDMFKSKAIVATVAARPLDGLNLNPSEIDLFIPRAEEMELDPAMEFVMVEERTGFYEADRHTLLALQKMTGEPFPLSEHLVHAQTHIPPPGYILKAPKLDMTSVLRNNKHETYESVDINAWPTQASSDLDASQLAALQRILAKRLAIVQGPPGTGKTHVSVEAIKIMLANRKADDPPIIIACQTNHAVDQILRHIAPFEPDFIRLGGRSKDQDVIKKRTLHAVKQEMGNSPLAGCLKANARKKMKALEKDMALIMTPLKPSGAPLDFRMLKSFGLLTENQAESLEKGASKWVQAERSDPNIALKSPFNVWMGKALSPVPVKQQPEEFGFDYEEADLAFEQLKEIEAENQAKDDEDFETLHGETYPLADNFTHKKPPGITEAKIHETAVAALKQQDMWNISETHRGAVYRYLQSEMKRKVVASFREKAQEYNKQAADRRIGLWEEYEVILKKQKIIGMTTTGASKYRGLLSALQPKIVLIEEAAETLEAPVTVACIPSLQHLILVGDHKQLRPHCHVKAHEDKPYYLNVSLFERLVNNRLEYDTLSKQRRMIPEIRRILHPIYGKLITDHDSVRDPAKRPNVPGMGGLNSFFFTHQWLEQRDDNMSAYNQQEAEMIVGFVEYLHYNEVRSEDITVLTFYNGQRKRILSMLRQSTTLRNAGRFNVVTVDSYQGEENRIVILSLVRSNEKRQIGFLDVANRVCVALSRAQCGFYLFGNGELLHNRNKIWMKVIEIMAGVKLKKEMPDFEPLRLGEELRVRCNNHNEITRIRTSDDWQKIVGGCHIKCKGKLPCGHLCDLTCHPFAHDAISCPQPCLKALPCGHGQCGNKCGELCECKKSYESGNPAGINRGSTKSWQNFSKEEPVKYNKAAGLSNDVREAPQSGIQVESKKVKNELLLDFGDDIESEGVAGKLADMKMQDGSDDEALLQPKIAQSFSKNESLLD
ncbi:P-loop containing nucleoside triphosphate hydrolase protein [Hortaea werneckii]|nr:P-loop containing nucleoside triphosphate hydrolase protein [Hortaea werneckii]